MRLVYFKILNKMQKPAFCPTFARNKAIWHDLWSFQNEAISLVAICNKELWLVEKNCATVKPDSSAPHCLENGEPRGHLIRVLNERSVNDGANFCLLWLVILKSAWYSVGDNEGDFCLRMREKVKKSFCFRTFVNALRVAQFSVLQNLTTHPLRRIIL